MRIPILIAVAALAATAMSFPAFGYCRGCVIETPATAQLASADATALPIVKTQCHIERQSYRKNGRSRWKRVEVCE